MLEVMHIWVGSSMERVDVLNIYNPGREVKLEEISRYVVGLGQRFILAGDFNAHDPLWDRRGRYNASGRAIMQVIDRLRLTLINSADVPTYIGKIRGTTSCLDLCIATGNLAVSGVLDRLQDLGSDHFPIQSVFGGMGINKGDLVKTRT